jgi:hypothetical protein
MSYEKKEEKRNAPIDFSHIGGKKVGHPVPVQTEKPFDFSSIGGKCVLPPTDHPMYKPTDSVEKEDGDEE